MSSEDLVGRLRTVEALIGKWREEVNERAGQGCGCYGRSTQLRLCADQLEAALRPLLQEVQPEPTEQPRPDRLTLNAYGRACYRAGERSASLRLSETPVSEKEVGR
jgi:hypothetical protein